LGEPFVGPSGEVLNDLLHTAGILRNQVYIMNVWPFMVTKNAKDIKGPYGEVLWTDNKGLTEPGQAMAEHTIDLIKRSGCNAILALGNVAMSLLTKDKRPITKWRGSLLWSPAVSKKFIPTIHPAATFHGWDGYLWRHLIINDMCKIKEEMDSPVFAPPERSLIISPTFNHVMDYFEKCRRAKRVCTDIEIYNHNVSCFSLAFVKDEAMTVPLVDDKNGHYWTETEEMAIWVAYGSLMSDPEVMKINQNIVGFDAVFLFMQNSIRTRGKLGDPMIAQHIVYPDFKKGLDFIASIHTREPYWKDDGKLWKTPEKDWAKFQRYCAKDACVALEAWDVLSQEMTDGGYWPTYDMTVRLAEPLCYMTAVGLAVDRDGLAVTKARLEEAIGEKQRALDLLTTHTLNVSSPKQCCAYFYETLGLTAYIGMGGRPTTDDKALSRIVRKGSKGAKEAKIIQELRALLKLKGTYIEVELDEDSRLRCSWNPRGTWTGRLSSSQTLFGTGMNLQNLHQEFKGFIVAG